MLADSSNMTVAEKAAALGVSVRHYYRLQARERAGKAQWMEREPDLDRFDYPYMELAESPSGNHPYHVLGTGTASHDGGRWHVGGKVRSLAGGVITTDVGGPTKHQPDPDGLKGGVG